MALFTGVNHRLVSGHTDGPMSAHIGIALHVNESNGNLYNWVSGDHDMSCHFEVYKDGTADQYLDTNLSSWCQMSGNGTYLSVETEGFHTEPFTPAQLDRVASIVAQAHLIHGIPLVLAEQPGQPGLGWHGMGGDAWGGHFGCPGDKRKAQRRDILAKARALVAAHTDPAPKPGPTPEPGQAPPYAPQPNNVVSASRQVSFVLLNNAHAHLLAGSDVYDIDLAKLGSKL